MASSIADKNEAVTTRLCYASLTILAGTTKLFRTTWKDAARTLGEEEIHDLRVASRRLREALRLFSPILPSGRVTRLSRKLRKVTRMLGDLRNADEAYLLFSSLRADGNSACSAELNRLLEYLDKEREQARKAVEAKLTSPLLSKLQAKLRALIDHPNLFKPRKADTFQDFLPFARMALAQRAAPLAALIPKAECETDQEAQHALRIAVKKVRYRLEQMEPYLPAGTGELRDALKRHQEVLGKLHDVDVFRGMLVDLVPEGPGREELSGLMARRRGELFAAFREVLSRFPLLDLVAKTEAKLSARGDLQGR